MSWLAGVIILAAGSGKILASFAGAGRKAAGFRFVPAAGGLHARAGGVSVVLPPRPASCVKGSRADDTDIHQFIMPEGRTQGDTC